MIGLIATIQIKQGSADEFERVFVELAAGIRASEPDNLTYQLCRSREDPLTYKVLEIYRDEGALKAHFSGEYVARMSESFEALIDGNPQVEYLDVVT